MTEPELTTVEITGKTAWNIGVKVNGRLLPCTRAELTVAYGETPNLTIDLPVFDGAVVTLENAASGLGDETREALISMGWTPPETSVNAGRARLGLAPFDGPEFDAPIPDFGQMHSGTGEDALRRIIGEELAADRRRERMRELARARANRGATGRTP